MAANPDTLQPLRPAAVAGAFYPAGTAEARAALDELFDDGPAPAVRRPKVLVLPHAGWVYSGRLAARALARLGDGAGIRRVVLLGPGHRLWVEGLALPDAAAFDSPLGPMRVDDDLAARVRDLPGVSVSGAAHAREHALEVQLPLLQRALGEFTLLPLVVGGATPAQVADVLDAVWGGEETLIVISTDLSHFHDETRAHDLDAGTAERIEALATDLHGEDACGAAPLNGALLCAGRRGLAIERVGLATSADAGAPPDRVVGYGAWTLSEPEPEPA
jgi:AmmeMemoRadiSam system protein B